MTGLQAVVKQLLADTDTPVSAYRKLCADEEVSFLFESGETVEGVGRYSIVAWDPLCTIKLGQDSLQIDMGGRLTQHRPEEFFDLARQSLAGLSCAGLPRLPFAGSLMGYIGYDAVRLIERLPPARPHHLPVANLCFPSRLVVFDHLGRTMTLVAICQDQATGRVMLADMEQRLGQRLRFKGGGARLEIHQPPVERFVQAVETARQHILAGDIFQVVLSDQFGGQSDLDPLAVYRRLRVSSPSPYMFYLDFNDFQLVGASPETLVKVDRGSVLIRPIAGTRGRSSDPSRDRELEREMLESEKERAEHIMLVDLSRNDAGRVSQYGTVRVEPYMIVERYSHVMHIVSQVQGRLRSGLDVWDAFKAAFPAGTVSGAPKVRAMEIIDDLEQEPRGTYAGAVGCFGPGQQMDTCIAIRMIQYEGSRFTLQTGAGIVADSVPQMEYREIEHKAAQGLAALRAVAEDGL